MGTPRLSDRPDCPYFHEDSHRQATRRACRLVQRSPDSLPWHARLCRSCPVPGLLRANPCRHLALEARVVRKWGVFSRVEPYTACTAKVIELSNPESCWRGCAEFSPPTETANLISVDALMASGESRSPVDS